MNIVEAKTNAQGDLELMIYGVIGSSWFEDGITANQVARTLKDYPNAKNIVVRLNSPGGIVAEGLAIRTTLQQHANGRNVIAHVDGIAASAASVIAMGAHKIIMHEGTSMMVHEANTMTRGDRRAHERALSALEAANDGMAEIYASRTGKAKAEMLKLMAAETWLTPSKAVSLGFADEVVKGKVPQKAAKATASWDMSKFYGKEPPAEVAAVVALHTLAVIGDEHITADIRVEETEDETMTYARIAIALGLAEGAEEATILSTIEKSRTAAARDRASVQELCELTGKSTGTEALGVARAYAQDHSKVEELTAQLSDKDKQLEAQERDAIIAADAADPKGRKLTPATVEYWKGEPVAKLKAFMEKASYVMPSAVDKKQQPTSKPAPDGTQPAVGAAASGKSYDGKKFGDMEPGERAQLKLDDPEKYRELRSEWKAANN